MIKKIILKLLVFAFVAGGISACLAPLTQEDIDKAFAGATLNQEDGTITMPIPRARPTIGETAKVVAEEGLTAAETIIAGGGSLGAIIAAAFGVYVGAKRRQKRQIEFIELLKRETADGVVKVLQENGENKNGEKEGETKKEGITT